MKAKSIGQVSPPDVLSNIFKKQNERCLNWHTKLVDPYLPAAPVGVVAFDPGFLPSRVAKWASRASSRLLGA